MRLFAAYLKQRVKVLVAFALFCVISMRISRDSR